MALRRFLLPPLLLLLCGPVIADEANLVVDTKTMHHKVMCGYQGWFRCAGDSSGQGWRHWSRDGRNLNSKTVTVEMWPDLSGFDDDEKYPATGFTDADGNPAELFSSVHPKTVDRHFQWMQQYGIDGVFLQRFLVELNSPSLNQVLANVRQSANKSGRTFGICYDLSGMSKDKLFESLVADWKKLVDEQQVTRDPRYLHHNNKPVLFIWGFYSDRFGPELAERIVEFFKNDPKYGVTLIGGCEWWWRTEKNPEWSNVFRKFDIISPWNPGNSTTINGERHAATGSWKDDLTEAKRAGMEYLPVIYPGFGWTNLVGEKGAKNDLPRLKGDFYWRQFSSAADLGIDMAYVAMFDEVDEATAIFKVTNSPPRPGHFVTYEGLPSDWYLRLTGEGTKLIRGELQNQITIPIKP
jgi:hypothetical protein